MVLCIEFSIEKTNAKEANLSSNTTTGPLDPSTFLHCAESMGNILAPDTSIPTLDVTSIDTPPLCNQNYASANSIFAAQMCNSLIVFCSFKSTSVAQPPCIRETKPLFINATMVVLSCSLKDISVVQLPCIKEKAIVYRYCNV